MDTVPESVSNYFYSLNKVRAAKSLSEAITKAEDTARDLGFDIPLPPQTYQAALRMYIQQQEARLKGIEATFGIQVSNDPTLMAESFVSESRQCIVFPHSPEELQTILGLPDVPTYSSTMYDMVIEPFLPAEGVNFPRVDFARHDRKTLLFVCDEEVAKAYIAFYVQKRAEAAVQK